jgi:phage terminase small subunit
VGTSKSEARHKKALFVEAMIQNGGNQTQAAERAGYKPGKASEQAGMRLSKDVWVLKELASRRAELQKAAHLETERVLNELAPIVFSDLRKVFNPDGTLMAPHEWPADIAPAIASFEVIETAPGIRTTKIKLLDKNAAIEKAMKHLGLYEKDNRQQGINPLAELLRAIDGKTRGL